jgi:hypothetical protein
MHSEISQFYQPGPAKQMLTLVITIKIIFKTYFHFYRYPVVNYGFLPVRFCSGQLQHHLYPDAFLSQQPMQKFND